MTIKDRIQQYLNYKKITAYKLEGDAGFSKGYWAKTTSISAEFVVKICKVYNDISAEWLLRGEGEMLKDNSSNTVREYGESQSGPSMAAENTEIYMTSGDLKKENDKLKAEKILLEAKILRLEKIIDKLVTK